MYSRYEYLYKIYKSNLAVPNFYTRDTLLNRFQQGVNDNSLVSEKFVNLPLKHEL